MSVWWKSTTANRMISIDVFIIDVICICVWSPAWICLTKSCRSHLKFSSNSFKSCISIPAKLFLSMEYLAFLQSFRSNRPVGRRAIKNITKIIKTEKNVLSHYENIKRIVFIQFTDRLQPYRSTSIFHIIWTAPERQFIAKHRSSGPYIIYFIYYYIIYDTTCKR